jgi:hypothetical protein
MPTDGFWSDNLRSRHGGNPDVSQTIPTARSSPWGRHNNPTAMATAQPNGFAEPLIPTAAPFRIGATPPLRAAVQLHIRDRGGNSVAVEFVVDSGAGISSIPWSLASCLGIPIGTTRVTSRVITAQGIFSLDAWRHQIEVEFLAIPGLWFVFDCQFPDVPSNVPPVLGIGGDVLRYLTIAFDGGPNSPQAPYGFVRINLISQPSPSSSPASVSP